LPFSYIFNYAPTALIGSFNSWLYFYVYNSISTIMSYIFNFSTRRSLISALGGILIGFKLYIYILYLIMNVIYIFIF